MSESFENRSRKESLQERQMRLTKKEAFNSVKIYINESEAKGVQEERFEQEHQ